MTRAGILGEVALDRDGVLHGWCWSPARPAERLTVEILVEDEIAASVTASRFREDVRDRRFGDGYHGFTVTLSRHLAAKPGLVRVRERDSGRVFWQKSFADMGIPAGFEARLESARAAITETAGAKPLAGPRKFSTLLAGLDAAGQHLHGSRFPGARAPSIRLPAAASPAYSLILTTCGDADDSFRAIAAASSLFKTIGAELILLDEGTDPREIFLAGRIAGAGYVYGAEVPPARLRNEAAAAARGATLVFLRHDGRRFDLGLRVFAALTGIIAGGDIAAQAARLRGSATGSLMTAPPKPYLGLDLAIPRDIFAAAGGFDEAARAPEAELLLRCLDFTTATVWREPRLPGMPASDGALPLA